MTALLVGAAGRYLTEEAAVSSARAGCRINARIAWRFLNSHGYINFGVAPELIQRSLAAPTGNGHVIVVGAGLAGELNAQPFLLN